MITTTHHITTTTTKPHKNNINNNNSNKSNNKDYERRWSPQHTTVQHDTTNQPSERAPLSFHSTTRPRARPRIFCQKLPSKRSRNWRWQPVSWPSQSRSRQICRCPSEDSHPPRPASSSGPRRDLPVSDGMDVRIDYVNLCKYYVNVVVVSDG